VKHERPFIVLEPDDRANPTDSHVVVRLTEWLAYSLGEKDSYSMLRTHPDYAAAARDRKRLIESPGVSLLRPKDVVLQEVDA